MGDCEVPCWKGQGEVDFVSKRPGLPLPAIMVTTTNKVPARETATLLEFARDLGDLPVDPVLQNAGTEGADGPVRLVLTQRWLLEVDDVDAWVF
ncbi:MAG: hypothetical protein AB7S61_11145 [Methanoregulaceae archaeon]